MFYICEPPPLSVLLITIFILIILLFVTSRCENSEFQENWENKIVLVNATQQKGIIIGGGRSREQGRMLKIRFENGNEIYISASQVTVLAEQKSLKEIEIDKLQMEITNKQNELNKLKNNN